METASITTKVYNVSLILYNDTHKMMLSILKIRRSGLDLTYIAVFFAAIVTIMGVNIVYVRTQNILKERLRERLISIASTAAIQFSYTDINSIKNRLDIGKKELREMTDNMRKIRDANENLKFIYLLRKTDDIDKKIFIADADTLALLAEIDGNQNGQLDDEEVPPQPGDEYDTSKLPALNAAFEGVATADYDLNTDQWGTFLSGYAPIYNQDNEVIAVLGIDVDVSDFNLLVRATLLPFIFLSGILLITLFGLTIFVTSVWKNRVEIVKEIDQQKDELLGIVSHQLATPVSSIKWYTEMMADGDLGKITKTQKDHLKSMQAVISNLSDLVSMILDVSRIQLGRVRVEKEKMDINILLNEIFEVIQPKAKEKSISLKIKYPSKIPPVFLDKRYTRMTIENLLTNAIKYVPNKGNVEFNLTYNRQKIFCNVKDNGCGIPKAEQEKIFGKLFRASNVRNSIDGNGFGLFVAKGAIEAQGGKIWFTSEENKGTTFFIELPFH